MIKHGYQCLCRNYKIKIGEIDIIAKKEEEYIFIEVKARNTITYGYPVEAVNFCKRNKIIGVSKYYLKSNNIKDASIRFDIIEVYMQEKKINHIKNVFF